MTKKPMTKKSATKKKTKAAAKKKPAKKHILKRMDGLYLCDAGHKGRGVFCQRDIRAGEIIEVTPALLLNEKQTDAVDETLLANYTFSVGKLTKATRAYAHMKDNTDSSAVVMGMGAFCNHSEDNNAEVVWEELDGTVYYTFRALRKIPKGTEICTSYGDGWFDDRK